MALQYGWWVVAIYVVGVVSVIYHWSNGLWTAAITWGLTISEKAQNRWKGVCAVMGIALTIFFVAAIVGALNYDVTEAEIKATEAANAEYQTPRVTPHAGDGEADGGGRSAGPDPGDVEIDLRTE
jgi:succinate dehydrogenase / fumarate reductase cytochrome b subunit